MRARGFVDGLEYSILCFSGVLYINTQRNFDEVFLGDPSLMGMAMRLVR